MKIKVYQINDGHEIYFVVKYKTIKISPWRTLKHHHYDGKYGNISVTRRFKSYDELIPWGKKFDTEIFGKTEEDIQAKLVYHINEGIEKIVKLLPPFPNKQKLKIKLDSMKNIDESFKEDLFDALDDDLDFIDTSFLEKYKIKNRAIYVGYDKDQFLLIVKDPVWTNYLNRVKNI